MWSADDGWQQQQQQQQQSSAGSADPGQKTAGKQDEESASDRPEIRVLGTLQQALRLTVKSSGAGSEQAAALRKELDEGWDLVRSGLSHEERIASLSEDVNKLQAKEVALTTRSLELQKEVTENAV